MLLFSCHVLVAMSWNFSPFQGRISTSLFVSQPMLVVEKNCITMKSLAGIPLQFSLWGLFCDTPLDVIFWLPCVVNLPCFSYMLNCATSYLSINLGSCPFWGGEEEKDLAFKGLVVWLAGFQSAIYLPHHEHAPETSTPVSGKPQPSLKHRYL